MSDKEADDAADSGAENPARSGKRRKARASDKPEQIDISHALEAPVRVKRDGVLRPVDPYEAMLRQHVRKSLVDKSVPSMKLVLGEAEKHKLIKVQPSFPRHGVLVIPKDVPEEVQWQIFSEDNISIYRIMCLLLRHISFERLMRCFNGR